MTCEARVISRLPFLPWKLPHWFAVRLSFSSISLSDILFCVCVSAWALLDSYLECSFCMIHYRRRCMRERGRRSSFESRKGWAGETRTEGKKEGHQWKREGGGSTSSTHTRTIATRKYRSNALTLCSLYVYLLCSCSRDEDAANRCMTQKEAFE